MFSLHCLVWLKKISYLIILYTKLLEDEDFYFRLLIVLENIIKCFTTNNILFKNLPHACFDIHKTNITEYFRIWLKENSKVLDKKV